MSVQKHWWRRFASAEKRIRMDRDFGDPSSEKTGAFLINVASTEFVSCNWNGNEWAYINRWTSVSSYYLVTHPQRSSTGREKSTERYVTCKMEENAVVRSGGNLLLYRVRKKKVV